MERAIIITVTVKTPHRRTTLHDSSHTPHSTRAEECVWALRPKFKKFQSLNLKYMIQKHGVLGKFRNRQNI